MWGKNGYIFPANGAHPYKRDLKDLEFHLLDTGHFALEEDGQVIANTIRVFMDKVEQYRPYIEDSKTIVTSPHKVYGPETNDLVLQLRKRGIEKVILSDMSANLCTESHMRELMEQGFEVAVVSDATAAAIIDEGMVTNQHWLTFALSPTPFGQQKKQVTRYPGK